MHLSPLMCRISKTRITSLALAFSLGMGVVGLCLLGSSAWAAIEPHQKVILVAEHGNGDYLNHIDAPAGDPTLNERVFNKGMANELKARYAAIYDSYEKNKNYGLGGLKNDIRYNDADKDLGSWTMHRMLDEQIRTPMRRYVWNEVRSLRHHDDDKPTGASGASGEQANGPSGASGASGAGVATAQAKPSSSTSLREMYGVVENFYNNGLWLNKETLMKFQYDMPGGTMNLAFKGGLVDTSLDYYVVPLNFSSSGGFGGNSANAERAAVSLNRGFRSLGFSTDMHYGLMSRSLSYGCAKTLYGPLSAGVNQLNTLADSSHNETTYRLTFGMTF